MQGPEDSRLADTSAARPGATRSAGKGKPPQQGDTLGALPTTQGGHDTKKAKGKEKPVKAPSKERTEPLNFRVTGDFRRAFKRAAAAQDCKKVELLERIFTEWSARNPA